MAQADDPPLPTPPLNVPDSMGFVHGYAREVKGHLGYVSCYWRQLPGKGRDFTDDERKHQKDKVKKLLDDLWKLSKELGKQERYYKRALEDATGERKEELEGKLHVVQEATNRVAKEVEGLRGERDGLPTTRPGEKDPAGDPNP